MEERSLLRSDSDLERKGILPPANKLIRLLKNVKYKVYGESTGNLYVFDGAGSTVSVVAEDADAILEKNKNRPDSCCGGNPGKIFEIVK